MKNRLVAGLFALAALVPLAFSATSAHAQQGAAWGESARIDGFDVEPVAKSVPGNELVFTLYGSPGGTAAVQIDGATGGLALVETEAGIYEGTYTIRTRDHITASSKATVNLRLANRVVSAVLDEPLIGPANVVLTPVKDVGLAPKIDRFDIVNPPARLVAGEELRLGMSATPGGAASAKITGVKGRIILNETRDGWYEGAYAIKNRDRIAPNAAVTGRLRMGQREASAVLGKSLVSGVAYSPPSSAAKSAHLCATCGVVEAINVVEVKGQGTYLGKIGGGLAGVLLGSQIGQGSGTTVAQVAGAVGGAYVGNEIEKRVKTAKHYEVVVRLDNGGSNTISYATQPNFAVGNRVKVENGTTLSVL